MYKRLLDNKSKILAEAREAAKEIGIPEELKGTFGASPAGSPCPGPLFKEIADAVDEASRKVLHLGPLVDEIRVLVKDVYGDEYDAAPTSTCEGALYLSFEVLATPPMMGRGTNYRARYITPYERHLHHQAGYGRPFPPKYKDFYADRGVTSGELGLQGKRLNNLDLLVVRMAGGKYDVHGIKYHPAVLMADVDAKATAERIAVVAERHVDTLSAITSLGYDSPGYGYGEKDREGTPILQKLIGKIADEYDIPYINDNASGLPFIGTDPRKVNAHVMCYSMDKAALAPTSGLIIGKEEEMVSIRRSMGMHGQRWGTVSSYGKAAFVTLDPGKEAIVGQIAALKLLRDEPKRVTDPVDQVFEIVKEEWATLDLPDRIKDALIITKSYNARGCEVNYDRTWNDEQMGIPIFNIEDGYNGCDILDEAIFAMGIYPDIMYDANCLCMPGLATMDEHGNLLEDRMRYCIQANVRAIEIIWKYTGIED